MTVTITILVVVYFSKITLMVVRNTQNSQVYFLFIDYELHIQSILCVWTIYYALKMYRFVMSHDNFLIINTSNHIIKIGYYL